MAPRAPARAGRRHPGARGPTASAATGSRASASTAAGACSAPWQRDGARWGFRATLAALADGAEVQVVGISGDAIAGDSVMGEDESPVAWRLPAVSQGEP